MPRTKNKYFLHKAVRQNRIEMVKWLIDNGAEVNSKNTDHKTPLHLASNLGFFEVVKCLIENGAETNANDNENITPLHDACSIVFNTISPTEISKCLLEKGAQIDAKCNFGYTPLHYATNYGNLKIAQFLIEKGAQIDAKTKNGETPLHISAHNSDLKIVRNLIEKQAPINVEDRFGDTALHSCIRSSQNFPNATVEVVKFLVENGASIDQKAMNLAKETKRKAGVLEYLTLKQKELLNATTPEETVSNKDPCIICNGPRNGFFILLPCAHGSLCEICCIKITKEKFSKCPQCRQPVKQYKKIFL